MWGRNVQRGVVSSWGWRRHFSVPTTSHLHTSAAKGGAIDTRWALRASQWRLLREQRRALLLLLAHKQQRHHGGREASRKEPVLHGKTG